MKLYAARDRNLDDMRALWPLASFGSPQQAAEQFWHAYPHAPEDPYLANSSPTSPRRRLPGVALTTGNNMDRPADRTTDPATWQVPNKCLRL